MGKTFLSENCSLKAKNIHHHKNVHILQGQEMVLPGTIKNREKFGHLKILL